MAHASPTQRELCDITFRLWDLLALVVFDCSHWYDESNFIRLHISNSKFLFLNFILFRNK